MAKRKSINKRLSRYNRSSGGSGFLDPNSAILGEEEPFWWNNLTNNANQSLVKYNAANQTSKYLDSDSQVELSDATNEWWNLIESTDSELSNNLHTVQKNKQPDKVQRITKQTMSDSDEDDDSSPPQKRKVIIRSKSRKSKSNPFLKAFIESENSKLSKSIEDATVIKPTNEGMNESINNESINNESLKESDFKEDYSSKKDNVNVTASTDQSHTTDKILKLKPQGFRKRYKRRKENVFEDVLKSAGDKHNETEATEIVPSNSSNKSIVRNAVSEENISEQFIINSRISEHDGNHIYYKHSDSSFETQSNHIFETSQKELSIREDHRNQTINSPYHSKEVNNSHISNKETKSQNNNDKNEKSFKPTDHLHTLNNSGINQNHTHSKINNSEQSFGIIDQENIDKEALIRESNIEDILSQSLSANKTLTNPVNTSLKGRKTDLEINSTNIRTSFEHSNNSNNTINKSAYNVTNKNFGSISLANNDKTSDSFKQMDKTNDHSIAVSTKDAIESKSNNNAQLKAELSTKLMSEESLSKNSNTTQPKELNVDSSTSKEKLKKITNIVTNNNSYDIDKNTQVGHKTINASNLDQKQRINEYFKPISLALTSSKVKKSKDIQLVKKTKEDEEIKKRLEQKKQKLDEYFSKTPLVTQLTAKELKERIQKLENEGRKKMPVKAEIHPAYLVNGKRYKRPKLPRPQSWVTDRFYRHLWKVMEPKFKLLTRVESEKFVKRLSNSASIIIKSKKYEDYKDELDDLMNNMARLGIIHTRSDFYEFSYQFLPYDFRVKVVPMVMPGNVKNIPYDPKKLHEPLLVK